MTGSQAESERLLGRLLACLPAVAEHQIERYTAFALRAGETDAAAAEGRAFAGEQAAGKAALQHLETLLKLLRWAESVQPAGELSHIPPPEERETPEQRRLKDMLVQARIALAHVEVDP